jgi:MFS superfamily sulfate permease-like transporter
VVITGILIQEYISASGSWFSLDANQLVSLPVANDFASFAGFFVFPNWEYLNNTTVWITGLTISLIASLETLLGIEAVDKLDPYNRRTPANRELKAQGIGNMVSGLLVDFPDFGNCQEALPTWKPAQGPSWLYHGLMILEVSILFQAC